MLAGPIFVSLVAVNIWASSDWLHSHGWTLGDSPFPFPSALALGPHGWLQIANYVVTGGLLLVFGLGFRRVLTGRTGVLASVMTIAFAGSVLVTALRIDKSMFASNDPETLSGWAHAFGALLGLLIGMLAMVSVGLALRRNAFWHRAAQISLLAPVVVIAAGFTPFGLAGSLLAVFGWYALLGVHLYRCTPAVA